LDIISQTMRILQLAQEGALAKGQQDKAQQLSQALSEFQKVITTRQEKAAEPATAAAPIASQTDFQRLLTAAQPELASVSSPKGLSAQDRQHAVLAMAASSMSEVDIARQLGMTREEVRLIIGVNQRSRFPSGGLQ
jgi:hypothetical protein